MYDKFNDTHAYYTINMIRFYFTYYNILEYINRYLYIMNWRKEKFLK